MKYKKIFFFVVVIFSIFIIGCTTQIKQNDFDEAKEEAFDSGVIAVDSNPKDSQVYVDGELKGNTPLTLYNIPVGQHKIVVKKEGYIDFEKNVDVKVGKTEELDVELNSVKVVSDSKPKIDDKKEDQTQVSINILNLSTFAMHFDFENKIFTELRTENSDLFSRRYDTYIELVALSPAKMKVTGVSFSELNRADCLNADIGFVQLHSGETLCIISVEGNFFALSVTSDISELEWKQLS